MKTKFMLSLALLLSMPALADVCTGSGYTFTGNSQSGGRFSGPHYEGPQEEQIKMQKGFAEDAGADMGLSSDDGLVSIEYVNATTIKAIVFVTRQNGSSQEFTLKCE